jgi:hypothetical protein
MRKRNGCYRSTKEVDRHWRFAVAVMDQFELCASLECAGVSARGQSGGQAPPAQEAHP